MNPDLGPKIDRRRLLTTLAGAGAVLIPGTANSLSERVFRFASPGDAAIVTNAGLIAVDPGLPRLGELVRRLDHGLRKRNVSAGAIIPH
jgi:hypothetical protein